MMKLYNKIFTAVAVSLLSQSVSAIPFAFEGRSLGMGGVAVATADLATASWANPAMLTNQRPSDNFSLLIGVGVFVRDNDDLVTDIENFQSADDRRAAAQASGDVVAEAQALIDMSSTVHNLEGKVIAPEASALAAMGMATDFLSYAISLRADAIAGGIVTDLSCQAIVECTLAQAESELTSTDYNILTLEGVMMTEFGFSIAGDFQLLDRKFSIGLKPKLVDLQSFSYRESILTASAGLDNITKEDTTTDLGTFTSADLGLAYDVSESFRIGLNFRNLITEEFKIQNQTLSFDTEARLGLAYHSNFMIIGVDYDLTENKPLLSSNDFDGLKTQYLMLGAEFNAFDFAQLRIGATKNVASDISDRAKETAYTAGIGFWLGFNLDIAATFRDNSVGGFLQTGFRF
jgi:hypothetical protein